MLAHSLSGAPSLLCLLENARGDARVHVNNALRRCFSRSTMTNTKPPAASTQADGSGVGVDPLAPSTSTRALALTRFSFWGMEVSVKSEGSGKDFR